MIPSTKNNGAGKYLAAPHWKRQQSWFHEAGKHDPEFVEKKGSIVTVYVAPPPRTRGICVDEMGPIAVKTYPGEEWKPAPNRVTFEPDYGRRGKLWVHGAFEPAAGQALILTSPGRDSASHVQLLEQIMVTFPAERWLIIEGNLSIQALNEGVDDWNAHRHPYCWKKRPQDQVTLLGGFGVELQSDHLAT